MNFTVDSKRISLLEEFLTTDETAKLTAALNAYYQTKLEQAGAIRRKQADPLTRGLPPRMDDEINLLEASGQPHSRAIRDILHNSTLPEMPKPTGLLNVDKKPYGQTNLADRLWLALCEFQRERANLDVGVTSLDVHSEWRDTHLTNLLEEALSDLSKAECSRR
jgi:hypothetical protein